MTKRIIPFSPPDICESEISEVIKTLESGWITTGKRTKDFERKIAQYTKTTKAVCLNSATAAMETTLRILGIGTGDEVITSAYTYSASAAVIAHVGAKIILVDTAPDSYQMDYDQLEKAITERTKLIIPVDIAGCLCDYEQIFHIVINKRNIYRPTNKIQKLYNRIIVMADSAHGFGAKQNGYSSGQLADFTCFSFHAVKNLTSGEGGAVVWKELNGLDSEQLYQEYMLMTLHGQSKDALAKSQNGAWEYDIKYLGYKFNMPDILAALGLKQLERYESILQRRKEIINKYDSLFDQLELERLSHFSAGNESSGHLYLIRVPGIDESRRNQLIEKLSHFGISTNVHYKPLPMMTAYKNLGFDISNYPNAYNQYKNEISFPLHTCLTEEDIEWISKKTTELFG